jgi:quercetin dioxygenase-like cupin family protein
VIPAPRKTPFFAPPDSGYQANYKEERIMVRRSAALLFLVLAAVMTVLIATALATPATPTIKAETFRGAFARDIELKTEFENDVEVEIETEGPIELVTQRVEMPAGSTLGWHTHPGENVNVIVGPGTLTLYHDEKCTRGIAYGPGSAFPTSPDQVHLARNETSDTLVFFATYFMPRKTPPLPIRVDAPLPKPGCPQ